ncbi:hypothetical protein [Anianabacter salinae]|uniref:hypothetical protein n=1 Tax=Anianabacter salinae TaxID=2851023 RepID=UPI00225E33A6|nr:hypothetical protein [Anianabacter salinae]MBV0910798.1 hypothetical protein [Anianabacter salinae]
MTFARLVLVLLLLWGAAYAWSVIGFHLTEPTGDGFTRGSNRVMVFFGWQCVAAVVGAAIWLAGNRLEAGTTVRQLSRVPLILAALLVAALGALLLFVIITG